MQDGPAPTYHLLITSASGMTSYNPFPASEPVEDAARAAAAVYVANGATKVVLEKQTVTTTTIDVTSQPTSASDA